MRVVFSSEIGRKSIYCNIKVVLICALLRIRHLERMRVTLSAAKGDTQDTSQTRSREGMISKCLPMHEIA
jgi:hypothetical protein